MRFFSLLTTVCIVFASIVSDHAGKPDCIPGMELSQTPFSCEAGGGTDKEAAGDIALAFNAVYRLFGGVDTEGLLVFRYGN